MRYTRGALLVALVMFSHESAGAGPVPAPASEIVDGINVGCAVDQSIYYNFNIPWCAFRYMPSIEYEVNRIEFMHGENLGIGSGTVLVQVRVDSLGAPATAVVTEGLDALSPIVSWQGPDVAPAWLIPGTQYWIVLKPVLGSQASFGDAFACSLIPWSISNDGLHWTPTARTVDSGWMVRFFGRPVTAVRETTWAVVKTLYR